MTAAQQTTAKRLSPFHHKQASLGAKFTPHDFEWSLAEQFTFPGKEREVAEREVGLGDLSHLTKLKLNGRDLRQIISRRYNSIGDHLRAQALIEGTGLYKNVLCAMLSSDEAMLVFREAIKDQIAKDLSGEPAHFTLVDVSSVLAGCCIVGPSARAVLRKLTELNVNPQDFPNLSVTHTPVRHVPTVILRKDVGTLLQYELFFERAYAEFTWDVIFSAGKELGLIPLGSSAMKLLGLSLG
jgi:heterotetrameric sarcosine oxidase gamma subunit